MTHIAHRRTRLRSPLPRPQTDFRARLSGRSAWTLGRSRVSLPLAAIAILWPAAAFGQGTASSAGTAWSILEQDLLVLFRILVVATVIERLLEYLSLAWPYVAKGLLWLWNRLFPRTQPRADERPPELKKLRKQLVLQSLGILIGIAICWRAQLGIFGQLEGTASGRIGETLTGWFVSRAGTWLDFVVTGILVGLGTEPIHSIITTILRRKDLRRARAAA